MQPVNFSSSRGEIGKQRQNDIKRIEHDAPGLYLCGLQAEPGQHSAQIKVSRLYQIVTWLCIDKEEFLLLQCAEFPVETLCIGQNALRSLLERDKNARFAIEAYTIDEVLQRENGFARSGTSEKEGCAPSWESAARNFIEADDTARSLLRRWR